MCNITPIHKKKDKQDITNYRPISLLPVCAKLFEKILFKNLYNHLVANNLLTSNQSGFRSGDSTISQLLYLVHSIYTSFDHRNSLEVRSVFLDISKAFDKVWHPGLLFKLKQIGIDGKLLILKQSYLSDRKQRVLINGFFFGMEANRIWNPPRLRVRASPFSNLHQLSLISIFLLVTRPFLDPNLAG